MRPGIDPRVLAKLALVSHADEDPSRVTTDVNQQSAKRNLTSCDAAFASLQQRPGKETRVKVGFDPSKFQMPGGGFKPGDFKVHKLLGSERWGSGDHQPPANMPAPTMHHNKTHTHHGK